MRAKLCKWILGSACTGLIAMSATAQTFTTLYSFTNGSDGAEPYGGLVLSGGSIYGTTYKGGGSNYGTVFSVNTNGMGFAPLYSFTNGSDGSHPYDALVLSGGALYGTAFEGGLSAGSVFAVSTNGSGFTNVYIFGSGSYEDGGYPQAGLILSGDTLYGTTYEGGSGGYGTVFSVNTNGTGFQTLYDFTNGLDGGYLHAGVVLSGNTLYGTAIQGGSAYYGTVFSINTNGDGFTNLYSFTNGSDGGHPYGGVIVCGDTLYGTSFAGGYGVEWTLYALKTNGTGFTPLYSLPFEDSNGAYLTYGYDPFGGLILAGNTLYGTTWGGGTGNAGTVFAANTNGSSFTILHNFTLPYYQTNSDGAYPQDTLMLSGNTLYGTAESGGASGYGTVFSLALPTPPQLDITLSGTNVILTWTDTAAGFTLQSTTNLSTVAWSANSPAPVIVNGQFTVTNAISGWQQFFRLSNP